MDTVSFDICLKITTTAEVIWTKERWYRYNISDYIVLQEKETARTFGAKEIPTPLVEVANKIEGVERDRSQAIYDQHLFNIQNALVLSGIEKEQDSLGMISISVLTEHNKYCRGSLEEE